MPVGDVTGGADAHPRGEFGRRLTAVGDAAGVYAGARGGLARIDDDDEFRALLRPASDRIPRLLELADGLAEGTLSEAAVRHAARAVADTQPFRRPR